MFRWIHCTRAALIASVILLPIAAAAQPAAQAPATASATSRFLIFLRATQIGTEESTVQRSPQGWTITSTGRIGAPLEIVLRKLEVKYDPQWKPLELTLDATARNILTTLHTVVTGTSALNEYSTIAEPEKKTDQIEADSILLPNPFFAPYEAIAARVKGAPVGTALNLYTAPQGTVKATVRESTPEKIDTASRRIEATRTKLALEPQGGPPVEAEIWGDENGRLLRVNVAVQGLNVVRDDIASVSARRVAASRPNDEQVRVPANGFTLAGTLSKPASATAAEKLPAVILVGGSGQTDRDETVFGVPIFGQVTDRLADAGFMVLRYDKRGVGQSGGRPESATLADYAEDLRAALKFLDDRKDVDDKRIAVLGHSEGGSVAMLAAARDSRVRALVLVATIGTTGAELNMAQVTHMMARSNRPEAEKTQLIEMQKQIQTAVTTGQGWEGVPPQLRKQADVPWFHSFLTYDPAKPMEDIRQPMLILQPELDTQVAPGNADKLAALAKSRKRQSPVDVVKVPGVNHLLLPAKTGEVDEYSSLPDRTVSASVTTPIVDWLKKTFAAVK